MNSRTASRRLFPRSCTVERARTFLPAAIAADRYYMKARSMSEPLDFPSDAWVAAYKDAINQNPEYAKAGKDWTHGVVAMVVKAEPSLGIPDDQAMWLDVHEGKCRDCKLMPAKDAEEKAP